MGGAYDVVYKIKPPQPKMHTPEITLTTRSRANTCPDKPQTQAPCAGFGIFCCYVRGWMDGWLDRTLGATYMYSVDWYSPLIRVISAHVGTGLK